MKKCKLLLPVLLFLTFVFPWTIHAQPPLRDGIIAIVNDHVITRRDLHEFLSMVYMSVSSSIQDPEEIKQIMTDYETNALDKLIDEKLKIDYAQKIELKIRPEAIDKRLKEIRSHYGSEREFLDDLTKQGMTLTDLRNKILDQFRAYYVEELEIKDKVRVLPHQVTDYYEQHREKFIQPEEIVLLSAFFAYQDNQARAEQHAQEAFRILKDPSQLAQYEGGLREVAEKFSGSVDENTLKRGEVISELDNIVFNLSVNDISAPVALDNGIYIFQAKEKTASRPLSLLEVKDKIYQYLFQQHYARLREEWLQKLRQEAFIEIKN